MLYIASSLETLSGLISKYILELVGVQDFRLDGGATEPAGEYTFFYEKGNENYE
jgi:hypothetical protein